jgi:hypothetical protein
MVFSDRQLPDGSIARISPVTRIPRVTRIARAGRITRITRIARRWRRRWRRRYEIPPRRYPVSDVYPVDPAAPTSAPAAPIRSPMSVPGPGYPRDVGAMWSGVSHTCAQSQGGESDHQRGRGCGDDFLEIHGAPPGAMTYLSDAPLRPLAIQEDRHRRRGGVERRKPPPS